MAIDLVRHFQEKRSAVTSGSVCIEVFRLPRASVCHEIVAVRQPEFLLPRDNLGCSPEFPPEPTGENLAVAADCDCTRASGHSHQGGQSPYRARTQSGPFEDTRNTRWRTLLHRMPTTCKERTQVGNSDSVARKASMRRRLRRGPTSRVVDRKSTGTS